MSNNTEITVEIVNTNSDRVVSKHRTTRRTMDDLLAGAKAFVAKTPARLVHIVSADATAYVYLSDTRYVVVDYID